MEDMAVVIGLATLIVTVGGIGFAQGRATRKSNEAAHRSIREELNRRFDEVQTQVQTLDAQVQALDAKNAAAHAGIAERIDSSRAEVLTQVRHLDAKNAAAHDGIVARADRHAVKLDAIARDVAFLAGRQKERDHRAGGDGGSR